MINLSGSQFFQIISVFSFVVSVVNFYFISQSFHHSKNVINFSALNLVSKNENSTKMEKSNSTEDINCEYLANLSRFDVGNLNVYKSNKTFSLKKLAIIVPFRDAFVELEEFAQHMSKFLNAQEIPFHIFIVQQTDNLRFNRGALINAGYLYIKDHFDYMAHHDVDYVPLNPKVPYGFPGDNKALHMVPWYMRPGCNVPKVNFK
jgi:hypothetical protein